MLGQEGEWQLTNRELAQRLAVDPGHLHFHVRMLLKAGLIELADSKGRGREKPYRAIAKVFRVAPELLAAGACSTSTVSATGRSSRYSSRVSNDSSTAWIASV